LGSAPPPRLYLIPLSSSVEHEGPLAFSLGHQSKEDLTLEAVTRKLETAVSGSFDGVVFPSELLLRSDRSEIYSRCQNRGLRIVHQVTCEAIHYSTGQPDLDRRVARIEELMRRIGAGDAVNFVFGACSSIQEGLLGRLTRWPDQVYFTYSVRKRDPVLDLLHQLQPFIRERLFFHFPYRLEFGDGHLSCQEVYDLTERIHSRVPGIRVRPMLGMENFDPRVDPDLDLEPSHSPRFQTTTLKNKSIATKPRSSLAINLEISVIIPSYNNRNYLLNTIKHLSRQDLSADEYEVIVVDDGSQDGSEQAVRELAQELDGNLNFKYIYSPRSRPRKMGDSNYRAGISRNLGVKNASGRILCFLDSDILTPPNFLSDLKEKHKRYDVIQCQRLNLVRDKSNAMIRFDEINSKTDTFLTEGGYWEDFYSLKEWSKEPFFWKYTCTYGLSVPATLFKRVGWIRRGFVFYGFEDVELGYRLAKVGARFHLNDMVTYHLFHHTERSEFHNSDYLRQVLLAKTAQIFYLGLLEPDIFVHFRGLMKEQLPLASLLKAFALRLGLNKFRQLLDLRYFKSFVSKPAKIAKPLWLMIPFIAIWNWRWFVWKLLQSGKKNPYLRPLANFTEARLHAMESFGGKHLSNISRTCLSSNNVIRDSYRRLGLWKFGIWRERMAGQMWRIPVLAGRVVDWLQLWRVSVLCRRLWSQSWRIRVLSSRTINLIFGFLRWWPGVAWQRCCGQILLAVSKLQLWRLSVVLREIRSQSWRIKVVWGRLHSKLWMVKYAFELGRKWLGSSGNLLRNKFHKAIQYSHFYLGQTWRIRVWWNRLVGWSYKMIFLSRALLSSKIYFPASKALWRLSYPIRKIIYFSKYQFETRIRGKAIANSSISSRPTPLRRDSR
jgi:glycosyltransferase involved in cell wall biosynthesis